MVAVASPTGWWRLGWDGDAAGTGEGTVGVRGRCFGVAHARWDSAARTWARGGHAAVQPGSWGRKDQELRPELQSEFWACPEIYWVFGSSVGYRGGSGPACAWGLVATQGWKVCLG